MKKIYHIAWVDGRNEYFSSLGPLFKKYTGDDLGISRYTLDRHKWPDEPETGEYKTDKCTIRRGWVISNASLTELT